MGLSSDAKGEEKMGEAMAGKKSKGWKWNTIYYHID